MTSAVAQLLRLAEVIVKRFEPMGMTVVDDGDEFMATLAELSLRFADIDPEMITPEVRAHLICLLARVNALAQLFYFYFYSDGDETERRPLLH